MGYDSATSTAPTSDLSKPIALGDYAAWLEREFQYTKADAENEYKTASSILFTAFDDSIVWREIRENIKNIHDSYTIRTGYELFYQPEEPKLYRKPFESFFEKTYRKNFVKPKYEARVGNFKPEDWYAGIDDVLRTLFVVKFLDGVDYLKDKIKEICEKHAVKNRIEYKCNDDGYYAAHLYIAQIISFPLSRGGMKDVEAWVEIQITTQLQEVLRKFLHKFYETSRLQSVVNDTPWQWRYEDDEFFRNYLGHILHNVEGMIMDLRRRRGAKDA